MGLSGFESSLTARGSNSIRQTGRTKTYYAREAICEYLEDLEDYYLADARTRNKVKAISLHIEVLMERGLPIPQDETEMVEIAA